MEKLEKLKTSGMSPWAKSKKVSPVSKAKEKVKIYKNDE